jgi:hypothetical protein
MLPFFLAIDSLLGIPALRESAGRKCEKRLAPTGATRFRRRSGTAKAAMPPRLPTPAFIEDHTGRKRSVTAASVRKTALNNWPCGGLRTLPRRVHAPGTDSVQGHWPAGKQIAAICSASYD